MPRMRTRAYNASKRKFSDLSSYGMSNDLPLMRARVIENNDELGIGRVKVRISSLHGTNEDGTKDIDLPWAYPCFFNASYDSGTFILPEVNNTVWVMFEDGNQNKPVYIGGVYGKGVQSPRRVGNTDGEFRSQRLGKNEVPDGSLTPTDKVIYKSPKGAKVVIRENKGEEQVLIMDQLGQEIRFDAPFNPEVSIANLENIDKLSLLDGKAKITVKAVNGSTIVLESDSVHTTLIGSLNGAYPTPLTFKCSTEDSVVALQVAGTKVDIGEEIVVTTPNEQVTMSDGSIKLKAPTVVIDADDIHLGGA